MKNNNPIYRLLGWPLAIVVSTTMLAVLLGSAQPAQQIVIIARDMKFTVVGSGPELASPALRFAVGTTVTVIFRNEDVGMRHDLVFEGMAVRSRVLAYGEKQRLTFTITRDAGDYAYLCSLHPRMMRGLLTVYDDR